MIRALVAEDSPTVRELLVDVLRSDPAVEVVGKAVNGLEAVEQAKALRPDVITMDIRMPLLDGLEATARIMVEAPTPIVIISSTIDPNDVTTTMGALRAGALTALPKPPGPSSPGFEAAAKALVETVKAMSQVKVVRRWSEGASRLRGPASAAVHPRPRLISSISPGDPPASSGVVAIVASTGGPVALHRILSELPAAFPAPILVVQHISAGFIDGVASWLGAASALRVKVAEHGEPLAPGTVYLAPDDHHLGAKKPCHVGLSTGGEMAGFRPSGDFLFESVANTFGPLTVAVVLTGMGHDGSSGLSAVRSQGGRIIVQDAASSIVYGMPAAALASGPVDNIVALSDIASVLARFEGVDRER